MGEEIIKITLRVTKSVNADIDRLASAEDVSKNELLIKAFKFYHDYQYSQQKASFLNQNILDMVQGIADQLVSRINFKTSQVLSELAIQQGIITQAIAENMEFDPANLPEYRKSSVEFLKMNQRVLRLDELAE